MRWPPRWLPRATKGLRRSMPRPPRRRCACSPRGERTWWPSALGRSTACTRSCGTSSPAGLPGSSRPIGPRILRSIRPRGGASARLRRRLASEVLCDVRTLDRKIADLERRIEAEVEASGTTLTEIFGIGPILAARIIGTVGDVTRFPTKAHFASYCGTAPLEASSGEVVRHRLSLVGNRKLNYALHMIAICQARSDARGGAYYRKKIDEGKSRKEALRCLKRRVSDAVFRSLMADSLVPSSSAA